MSFSNHFAEITVRREEKSAKKDKIPPKYDSFRISTESLNQNKVQNFIIDPLKQKIKLSKKEISVANQYVFQHNFTAHQSPRNEI